jgi:hypothetical protein
MRLIRHDSLPVYYTISANMVLKTKKLYDIVLSQNFIPAPGFRFWVNIYIISSLKKAGRQFKVEYTHLAANERYAMYSRIWLWW